MRLHRAKSSASNANFNWDHCRNSRWLQLADLSEYKRPYALAAISEADSIDMMCRAKDSYLSVGAHTNLPAKINGASEI